MTHEPLVAYRTNYPTLTGEALPVKNGWDLNDTGPALVSGERVSITIQQTDCMPAEKHTGRKRFPNPGCVRVGLGANQWVGFELNKSRSWASPGRALPITTHA